MLADAQRHQGTTNKGDILVLRDYTAHSWMEPELLVVVPTLAQDKPPEPDHGSGAHGHHPPPSAYEDCKGRKPGERVQHTTPQGTAPTTCEPSPEGMVA
jgi:hypothetical protein